jgi:hypothetical protein
MADIGQTLREARMRSRIDIGEVELRTKIRAKYLRAIENEEWDLLPGPVYVKSFLRTYGDFLGLDSRMLIDEYKRRYERLGEGELRPIATINRDRERRRGVRGPLLPPWVIVLAVLLIVVGLLAVVGLSNSNKGNSQVTGLHGRGRRAPPPPTHVRTTPPRRVARRPTVVRLAITPTAPVYVCAANGSGKLLVPGVIYQPGQTVPLLTAGKLLITFGNSSVQLKVDGKPETIAPSSAPTGLEFTPRGRRPLAAAEQPRCA